MNILYYSWSKKHSADKSQAVAGAIGSTALHVACANGCAKIVDLLLRNGAMVNVKDKYGSSPLDIAAAKHHVEIVRLLETFGALQQQKRRQHHHGHEGRRSMDVATMSQSEKAERFRRPSLPSVFEGKAPLHVPPISTLPSSRRTTTDDDVNKRPDWYGYGVVNQYDDENYLLSLERRAFGLAAAATSSNSSSSEDGNTTTASNGHIPTRRASSTSLKRCSSDGGHLRTTALMNAMAANNPTNGIDGEPTPRPSVALDDGPEAEELRGFQEREMKKAWWSAFGGRKSMDVATYHYGRGSLDVSRKSLDLRPSLDSLSQLAKKSVEGLSRKSVDERPNIPTDHQYSVPARPSFLSRIVGAWSKK